MKRTAVDPVTWAHQYGFHQGVLVTGQARTLYCAGQTATGPEGQPLAGDDVGGQLLVAVENLEGVLRGAGMTLADVVRLTVYSTDVDGLMPHLGLLHGRPGAADATFAMTLVQVVRLAIPGQVVELEATAVA